MPPKKKNNYRAGTRRYYIAESLLKNGFDRQATYTELKAKAGKTRPFYFKDRRSGEWLEPDESRNRLYYEIGAVIQDLGGKEKKKKESTTKPAEPVKPKAEHERFLDEVRRLRKFCIDRNEFDHISMRPVTEGAKGLREGIPAEALIASMTLHWSKDSKRQAGLKEVNLATVKGLRKPKAGEHRFLPYVEKLAAARIPINLVGPAGTGKSFMARQLARALDTQYGECPLTAGATPSWLFGRQALKGYIPADLVRIYESGGVFCFEELDSADANMLLAVNNMLANDELHNPITGDTIVKHPDFIPVATSNTFGEGGTRQYTGRERLDAATIDRWRMGRVYVPLDEKVEAHILETTLAVGKEEPDGVAA